METQKFSWWARSTDETLLGNLKSFPRTFNKGKEKILHHYIKCLDSYLMPLNKTDFLKHAYQFAEKLKIQNTL